MQNEKMMILKMLESGKISTEEASRLLQSVDTGGTPPSAPAPTAPPTGGYSAPSPSTPLHHTRPINHHQEHLEQHHHLLHPLQVAHIMAASSNLQVGIVF